MKILERLDIGAEAAQAEGQQRVQSCTPNSAGKRFLRTMYFLIASHCFRLRDPPPRINTGNHFDPTMDDVTTRTRFNFTVRELQQLATKLQLPTPVIVMPERDAVPTVEALAMLCRRLKEPSLLFTVANEFGRSPAAYSRICQQ
ncbi:hypothetical protein PC117_g14055 [Phytophthora cactorum]|uniref:Uncharacterized protein n=1 Tax=Phytophthora cactorum TaxID=29920 RepID=A0A8T1CUB0_9STRA|nr:hypothetical protein PC117_g14055 [Phytophthora cactorum]